MESKRYIFVKCLSAVFLVVLLQGCCWFKDCEECFEDPNLFFPDFVTDVRVDQTTNPTFFGPIYYPTGTILGVPPGSTTFNEFFSVTRFVEGIGSVTYFWNRDLQTPIGTIMEGETVTYYKMVANTRTDNSLDCLLTEPRQITTVLDVKVRAENGEIIGTREVEKTILEIPSGKTGIFNFDFVFFACGQYEFDIEIDPNGQLAETTVFDNNYSEVHPNFGSCN